MHDEYTKTKRFIISSNEQLISPPLKLNTLHSLTARTGFFSPLSLRSVWSYLCEPVPVFVCVPSALSLSLPVYSALTSRQVDPLTVIPLPNLRGVSEGAQSAQY